MKNLFLIGTVFAMVACSSHTQKVDRGISLFDTQAFDTTLNGKQVSLYTLQNTQGMAVQITNYGARVVDLWVPSADSTFKDVVWGYENIKDYLLTADKYCGPVVGRYGNRIGKGQFMLDGKTYQLSINNGANHLHGGTGGFEARVWTGRETVDTNGNPAVEMSYLAADGEEGYPGNLSITVTYSLTPDNRLVIGYRATTDAPTVVNPTSHVYFNLHGTSECSTDSHIMMLAASHFTPTDSGLIPTGEIIPVDGTPMDFRTPITIGARLDTLTYGPMIFGGGYDHNWVLDNPKVGEMSLAAELYEPSTGIVMKISTDQPGFQFYSGNGMDGKEVGKRGDRHNFRSGIALETQNFPDAPNHDNFPSSVLRPGETYTQTSIYAFEVKR